MAIEHTPGPWTLKSEPYEDGTPYHVIKGGRGLWAEQEGDGFNFNVIATDADARLMVAAPDLLEALQAMFKVYGKTCSSTLAAQVSDALAKASPDSALHADEAECCLGLSPQDCADVPGGQCGWEK